MTRYQRALACAATLALSACATAPRLPSDLKPTEAMLAPHIRFAIPHPQSNADTISVSQSIVAQYGKRKLAFRAQIQISGKDMKFAALDGFGRRVLTLSWNATGLQYKGAPWLKPKLRPADILADIAIVYWPAARLNPALSAARLKLITTGNTRKVLARGRQIMAINYGTGKGWNRSAALINNALGYTITIQSVRIGS